jgi:hypothetical protein
MSILPSEILNVIFILLSIKQKQESMFVCKRWASLICSHILLHIVNIDSKVEIFKDFIPKIKHQPQLGLQVFDVTLTNAIPQYFDRRDLLYLFPNIRVIKAIRKRHDIMTSHEEEIASGPNCGVYLEKIEDSVGFEMTRLALATTSSRLVSFILDFHFKQHHKKQQYFPAIKECAMIKILDHREIFHYHMSMRNYT